MWESYGADADRRWLQPLVETLFSARPQQGDAAAGGGERSRQLQAVAVHLPSHRANEAHGLRLRHLPPRWLPVSEHQPQPRPGNRFAAYPWMTGPLPTSDDRSFIY